MKLTVPINHGWQCIRNKNGKIRTTMVSWDANHKYNFGPKFGGIAPKFYAMYGAAVYRYGGTCSDYVIRTLREEHTDYWGLRVRIT